MKQDAINYKALLLKALRYWYLFAASLILSVGAAYYIIKSTPPAYKANALLLIKDDEKSGQQVEAVVFKEIGLASKSKNIENEIFILRSTPLMKRVVKNLELNFQYFYQDGLKKRDLYTQTPVKIAGWQPEEENTFLSATLEIKEGLYYLDFDKKTAKAWGGKQKFLGEFGKELQLPIGKLTLTRANLNSDIDEVYLLISPVNQFAKLLVEKLEVEAMSKESSTLFLSIKDEVPQRAEMILNELISEYNKQSIEDKNQSYKNSLDLLSERINIITEELTAVEMNAELYKRRNNMLEISAEGNMLVQEMANYNKSITSTDVQLEILKTIEDFLVKNQSSFEFVPTNLSLTNLTLTNQLTQFNQLLTERTRLRGISGPAHPDVIMVEKQIQNLRQTIIENIRAMKSDLLITRNANANLRADLERRIQSLPRQERELVEIERRKGVKETLFLYLLQKREESALSMAITVPTGKVVEPAEAIDSPISPKKAQIGLIALFLGLALPTGLVLLLDNLNDKIQLEEDIEKETGVAVVGMLAASRNNYSIVVKEKSRSVEAEMFRLLRANLAYISPGNDIKTLLITSSVSGEGKSFIALNLGITQALSGKKVVIVELDLRKPKQGVYAGLNNKNHTLGVVNYLIDSNMYLEKIIQSGDLHPNLDIISCGAIPPNPGELIMSPRLRELIDELRERYDFIILDTPPVGMVADTLQMQDLAEATMYVVRIDYTKKGHLQIIKDIAQKKKLPKPFVVVNAINLSKLGGYSYAQGYGYTYGYAYASNSGYYEKS